MANCNRATKFVSSSTGGTSAAFIASSGEGPHGGVRNLRRGFRVTAIGMPCLSLVRSPQLLLLQQLHCRLRNSSNPGGYFVFVLTKRGYG